MPLRRFVRTVSLFFKEKKIFSVFTILYDDNFTSIIDIYFYETFSTPNPKYKAHMLHSLDTLSDIRIKAFTLLF